MTRSDLNKEREHGKCFKDVYSVVFTFDIFSFNDVPDWGSPDC